MLAAFFCYVYKLEFALRCSSIFVSCIECRMHVLVVKKLIVLVLSCMCLLVCFIELDCNLPCFQDVYTNNVISVTQRLDAKFVVM